MEKTVNLLGIREKAILCRIRDMYEKVVMMIPITKEQEDTLEHTERLNLEVSRKSVICYGEVDIDNPQDAYAIKKFDLLGHEESDNFVHSNFDYEKGCFTTIDGYAKGAPTSDAILWYRYNYVLIGKPKRVLIFKINKSDL